MKDHSSLDAAVACVVESGQASPSLLCRQLGLTPDEARRTLEKLEWLGIVGRSGTRRVVLLTPDDWTRIQAA